MSNATFRSALEKVSDPMRIETDQEAQRNRDVKRRLWDLRKQYRFENDITLLPRCGISTQRQNQDGWHFVTEIIVMKPYGQVVDVLWRPSTNERPEQVIVRYAFHR